MSDGEGATPDDGAETAPSEGETHTVRLRDERDGGTAEFAAEGGAVLRDALVARGRSPHSAAGRRVNCGGRGLCATCGVRVARAGDSEGGEPSAAHWHDRLAARFGYPRLSCQLRVREDLLVTIPDKRVW